VSFVVAEADSLPLTQKGPRRALFHWLTAWPVPAESNAVPIDGKSTICVNLVAVAALGRLGFL
jgi:hypothetical protein